MIVPDAGQVVVAGSQRIAGYDLKDGHEVWTVRGLPYQVSPSPVMSDGSIYFAAWDALGGGSVKDHATVLSQYDKDSDGNLSRAEFARHCRGEFPKYDRNKDGAHYKRRVPEF